MEPEAKGLSRRGFVQGALTAGAAGVVGSLLGCSSRSSEKGAPWIPSTWDHEADVIVVGLGSSGMMGSVAAALGGATVIGFDQNHDVGGCGMLNGGNYNVGGGTAGQIRNGIEDSPEVWFNDLTSYEADPDVAGAALFRKNDRELVRALAENGPVAYQMLEDYGVVFAPPSNMLGEEYGRSAARCHTAIWTEDEGGTERNPGITWHAFPGATEGSTGAAIMRPMEAAARSLDVEILLKHRLTRVIREGLNEGRVLGVEAETEGGEKVYFHALKGVLLTCGGNRGNGKLRAVWDPRLASEKLPVTGEPWVFHRGEGIMEAQKVGAQVASDMGLDWHLQRLMLQFGTKYGGLILSMFLPGSSAFEEQDGVGFSINDFQNYILVKSDGLRFCPDGRVGMNGVGSDLEAGFAEGVDPLAESLKLDQDFLNRCLKDGNSDVWAIFDENARLRENLDLGTGVGHPECFIKADTLDEVAEFIEAPADVLKNSIERYNSFVDSGVDIDFEKPTPQYKIDAPPFYAAARRVLMHDTKTGVRINGKSQVLDVYDNPIPGLYAAGEMTGGLSVSGNCRALTFGMIAGQNVVKETPIASASV